MGYLKEQIEIKLEASFGFEIPVLVITKAKLEDILNVLENEVNEIDVDSEIAKKAFATIDRMLKL